MKIIAFPEHAPVTMKIIAYIENDFHEKFGIPRQSGLSSAVSRIIFTPPYRNPEALRGITDYSHLWLIWEFSRAIRKNAPDVSPKEQPSGVFHATVRPPRLGGDTRVGVWATRSPFRPNPIGLSVVRLLDIEPDTPDGPVLIVEGADLMNGTPIYDIKPYLPYVEAIPDAKGGFSDTVRDYSLTVDFPRELLDRIPADKQDTLISVLSQDPRPPYNDDPERIYGMSFGGYNIRFRVAGGILTVTDTCEYPTFEVR